ncbi:tocopherol cyclase family protein [Clostridium sp. AL.422]|uniref:tocopherol cyclase family protein n=1 Tax=Clostridium TaxID=1485 RepID=UPI00293DEE1C|nr:MULTISPECIES: tocopherol cyclase family protein [unclassified Clostridium]MDV4151505.1 tocopherol cyclase family protein [Clostridium sp. AL.422]
MKSKEIYKNKKSYFEGWYFKHQTKYYSIAFIPGININKNGEKYAFIQIITEDKSYNINYDFEDFYISEDKLTIKIRDNIFSIKGIKVNIKNKDISIIGELSYNNITPIKGDIMGPFAHFPFMECFHGVLSANHNIEGSLSINNEEVMFTEATGYIEKDWGKSFPKTYLWIQCNNFKKKDISVMVSIADIPFLGFEFKGCIALVYYEGREYRLATYNGVKIISYNEKGIIIKRGSYRLEILIKDKSPQSLLAPNGGEMIRTIKENISCNASFKFYKNANLIFNLDSNKTSFEYVSN